ncbi:MAG: hypothetical protein LRY67_02575 [Gammaproteobacteria bacterium]|nr:hypothetical protein [Gammaproteobacteria bacterium]
MIRYIFSIAVAFFCVSCTSPVSQLDQDTTKRSNALLQEAKNSKISQKNLSVLPSTVVSNLTPLLVDNTIDSNKATFDLSVKDMPVRDFLMNLMQDSGENIVISPELTGNITLTLYHATVPEVLRTLQVMYGFYYTKTSLGYEVLPKKIEARVFYVSHINLLQTSDSVMTVKGPELTDSSNANGASASQDGVYARGGTALISHFGEKTFWLEINETLKSMVQNDTGSYVNTNTNTGVVVVAAYPDTLKKVAEYLQAIQEINNRQVIIDAKIIELSLYKQYQTGINWGQTGLNIATDTGIFSITNPVSMTDINSVVTLLSTQGDVNVLSNPRISVINNRPALIKVGNDSYYVTSVSSGTTPVGTTATVSSDVGLTPFFSGVSLNVIPSIMPNGTIKLYIHPMVSLVKDDVKEITLSETQTLSLPLASSDIREADSNIEMESGQIIVLGGLMQRISRTQATSFAGSSWSEAHPARNDSGVVTELVILMKATLADQRVWQNEIKTVSDQYKSIQ